LLIFLKYIQVEYREGSRDPRWEFRLNTHIVGYKINDVMLDLGSDVNILPKKTWEAMGKPKLVYSPIQLWMANQYCIYPVGRLQNVEVDLDGVKTMVDFEVIEIMGEKDPYPTLLGIDWAYENFVVIDLKKELMTFEADGMKVTQPLDPYRGPRFTDPGRGEYGRGYPGSSLHF
jgi:hypothetical protein